MSPDIAPYTEREAETLGTALTKLGVPSFGPGVGVKLLEIAVAVKGVANRPEMTPAMRAVMMGFHARLLDIARVGHAQAGEVIARLDRAVKGPKGGCTHGS